MEEGFSKWRPLNEIRELSRYSKDCYNNLQHVESTDEIERKRKLKKLPLHVLQHVRSSEQELRMNVSVDRSSWKRRDVTWQLETC